MYIKSSIELLLAMISSRQIRAARALLGWSQQDLADHAILSLNAIKRLEANISDPRISTFQSIKKAMETNGIEFISSTEVKGEGVRITP